jgi:hypothetical protein
VGLNQKDYIMKIRTIVAASALAATGVIGAVSQSASAGCGVSITADNVENQTVTVNWSASQVRAKVAGVAGPWKSIGTYSTNIAANSDVVRAFTLDLPCGNQRQYRLWVDNGEDTYWEYHNEVGPSGFWTQDITPYFDISPA